MDGPLFLETTISWPKKKENQCLCLEGESLSGDFIANSQTQEENAGELSVQISSFRKFCQISFQIGVFQLVIFFVMRHEWFWYDHKSENPTPVPCESIET